VRPLGHLAPLGLLLPPSPLVETAASAGTTGGATSAQSPARNLARFCAEAETLGAGGLWAIDHLFWHAPMIECLTTLAVAACATERIPIGSCVLQLPLRNPAAVAKQASALQQLSGGRMVLGMGVGSHPGEYEAVGVDYALRGRLLDEGIAALRDCWAEPGGRYYHQAPQGPPIPLWFGGTSDAALSRAARQGDGYVPMLLSVADYGLQLDKLDKALEAADRPSDALTRAVVVMLRVGVETDTHEQGTNWLSRLYGLPPKAFNRHLFSGTAEACVERLAQYVGAGAQHLVLMLTTDSPLEQLAQLLDAAGPAGLAPRSRSQTKGAEVPT
jgi:alkanesulfonate monooxygenase SsuD/methylene tetrahydromethanopterin reductase-like flavin-dependent oxidoreductase (luciferase family)